MKKIILIVIITIGGALLKAQAQDMQFGIKGGLNFSKFRGDIKVDGTTSAFIGGFADIALSNEQFHIQPELIYSSEGGKNAGVDFIKAFGIFKYYTTDELSLEAGPYMGLFISGDSSVEDAIDDFDFGLSFGAGYELKDIGLLVNARYNFGIANIIDTDAAGNIDVKTGTFQIGIGYKFK